MSNNANPPVPQSYTLFWSKSLCDDMYLDGLSGEILDYTGGSRSELGTVRRGDQLYVVTVIRGDLFLIGRLTVAAVLQDAGEAEAILGYEAWNTPLHAIADRLASTPMFFLRSVERGIAQQLRFTDADGSIHPIPLQRDGSIHPGDVRGLRPLDLNSAMLLESVLDQRWYELPHSPEREDEDEEEWRGHKPEIPDKDFEDILTHLSEASQDERLQDRAIAIAIEHYEGAGFTLERRVDPVLHGCNLFMRRNLDVWRIGVRGLSGSEIAFSMSDIELRLAFDHEPYEMLVITDTMSSDPGLHRYSGTELDELFDFRSISYVLRLRTEDPREEDL